MHKYHLLWEAMAYNNITLLKLSLKVAWDGILGLQQWLSSKESVCNAGDSEDSGLIPGLGRYPGRGHGNPLQCSGPENLHGQRSLMGYSPWGCEESDTTERLSN